MIAKFPLTQALALIGGDMANRMPAFEIRTRSREMPPTLDWRRGEPTKHYVNRLLNRRNPNRQCKLLRRIKTTC